MHDSSVVTVTFIEGPLNGLSKIVSRKVFDENDIFYTLQDHLVYSKSKNADLTYVFDEKKTEYCQEKFRRSAKRHLN